MAQTRHPGGVATAPGFKADLLPAGVDRLLVTHSGPRAHRIAFRKVVVLDHRDTSKRERRSIVAQRHAAHGAEGITRFERTCCSSYQRLHLNTATLVTPTVRLPVPNYLTTNNER
jgi:adenosylmethionine-8-amino-7-oxononanoate aminotransferase